MDGRWQLFIIVLWFVFASLSAAKIHIDERRNLATQNPGFISIDCGIDEDYQDETTGLYYKSDKDYVSTGMSGPIAPEFDDPDNIFARLYKNVRYFPEGNKNCYSLKPEQGKNNNYLLVAYFKYGNYDGKNQAPNFDLYLGASYWATIEISDVNHPFNYPAFYFSPTDVISVCLINRGTGIPFISALELRTVNNSIYRTDSGFATVERRFHLGKLNDTLARYKDDVYDRIWTGLMPNDWILVNTTQSLQIQSSNDSYKLPSEVLKNAVQPRNNRSLSFSMEFPYPLRSFNVYFFFNEIQKHFQSLKREFTITLNGVLYGPYTPQYLKPFTIVCERAKLIGGKSIQFSINPTAESKLPPFLNGFEILIDKITNASETSLVDVGAIMAIKRIYNIDRPGWQGDPCQPQAFSWDGLNCSYVNDTPRITSLNLSSSELSGVIASEFSNLRELQSLDLSNNELNGTVPEFLAELPKLVNLNLSGNLLTGPLPQSLIEKFRNGTLKLSFERKANPNPCTAGSCDKKKRNVLIPIMISIISLLVLVILLILAIFWRMKTQGVLGSRTTSLLMSKNRSFAYSEIVTMTDNFTSIIGEGGFGKVYIGELNDGTQVAVKLLSQSSKQGLKEFLSEVQLLIMVYHRNLVSLVGYCEDHENMALVYEYMLNGNLRQLLSEKSSYVLNWRERIQIAVDAAQGLEYLHNGCKPPIIHRDFKTCNILLNENFVAKISDFGLSRVFATDKDTHVSTNPAGTFGYVDPEFYTTGNLNKKSDVYSFGIILFELVTGQPVVIKASEDQSIHILQLVIPMIESGDIQSIIDKKLDGEFNINSAWKIVEIAMSCIPKTAVERPDMSQVLIELKECLAMDMASGGSQTMRSASSRTRSSNALPMSSTVVDTQVHPRVR